MNKGAKKELLIDTFDVLKDMWPAKREAIVKIMRSMRIIDLEKMMEMWEYLIKKNEVITHQNSYESAELLEEMVSDIFTEGCIVSYADKAFSLAVYQNKTISKYLFSINPRLGKYTSAIVSNLMGEIPLNEVEKILNAIGSRKGKEDGLGNILTWIIERFRYNENLNNEIKDFLLNYIGSMSDKTERAVAYAAYLEID
ncbi:MAG: hypothetical protein HDT06_01385 [Bacteroidales bacterium]|nr:hypothetical protein [Bacteroidales bacterium]